MPDAENRVNSGNSGEREMYQFIASMDVDEEKEALFNEVYDTEHVPSLLKVAGVRAVTRFKTESFSMAIGGEVKTMPASSPRYTAIYDIDSPDVVNSSAWGEAVEAGRWPGEVRPFTKNRHHEMRRKLD